ncbi:MAG: hypothetical protein RRB13_10770 [bacterium]|nr:hypothetical protein [bacterium]
MFNPIQIPADAVMLFNIVKLKPGVTLEDVELEIGEMCNVVKSTYGNDQGGFIAGQVFKFSGFISKEGSMNADEAADAHYAIVTYWKSFDQHEHSHADQTFLDKFNAVLAHCTEAKELGYELLWQGSPE